VTKNNFTCIHCANKDDTQCDCYSLLTTVTVWYAQFIQRSSNAVTFAVS